MQSVVGATMMVGLLAASSAFAADCRYERTTPMSGGVQPPLIVDATCTDPDFNDSNFVIDEVTQNLFLPPPFRQIPYTRVRVHFNSTKTAAQLAAQGLHGRGASNRQPASHVLLPPGWELQESFLPASLSLAAVDVQSSRPTASEHHERNQLRVHERLDS